MISNDPNMMEEVLCLNLNKGEFITIVMVLWIVTTLVAMVVSRIREKPPEGPGDVYR